MAQCPLESTLVEAIEREPVIVVVGSGISRAASGEYTASWEGLLDSGLTHCVNLGVRTPEWSESQRVIIHPQGSTTPPTPEQMIAVATEVVRAVSDSGPDAFQDWLKGTVGRLRPRNPGALKAILELDAPIVTTNYDKLIEQVAGTQFPAGAEQPTWRDRDKQEMFEVVRGWKAGVVHLHGRWDDHRSVVLDSRSYRQIRQDDLVQQLARATWTTLRLVFVGFGSGMYDPNFTGMWTAVKELRKLWPDRKPADRHFWLRCKTELRTDPLDLDKDRLDEIVQLVEYGDDYPDLTPYLEELSSRRKTYLENALAVIDSTQADPHREMLSPVSMLRRFNDGLLTTAARRVQPPRPKAHDIGSALGCLFQKNADFKDWEWTSEYVRQKVERRLSKALPTDIPSQLHEHVADYYSKRLGYLTEEASYAAYYSIEDPRWRHLEYEWLYHETRVSLDHRREPRLKMAHSFLKAFWWWGYYIKFDHCQNALDNFHAAARNVKDEQFIGWMETIHTKYPTGYAKSPDQRRWAAVREALENIWDLLELDGTIAPKHDDLLTQTRGMACLFRAHTYRFVDPFDPMADRWYNDARRCFRKYEKGEGDVWNLAWTEFEVADLAIDRGLAMLGRGNHVEACHYSEQAVRSFGKAKQHVQCLLDDDEPDHPDHEVIANLHRVRADAYWIEGDAEGAFVRYQRAVLHSYLFNGIPHPPDDYTDQFYREMCDRTCARLIEYFLTDGRAAINQAASIRLKPPHPDDDRTEDSAKESIERLLRKRDRNDLRRLLFAQQPSARREQSAGAQGNAKGSGEDGETVGISQESPFVTRWRAAVKFEEVRLWTLRKGERDRRSGL